MGRLENKVILITGASRGIGAACVKQCVEEGAQVLANCRSEDSFQQLLSSLNSHQERVHPVIYDVTDSDSVRQQFKAIQSQFGKLYGLVNNAGVMLEQSIAMTRKTALTDMFETNAASAFEHTQLAARLMTRNKQGSVVNVGSIVGAQGAKGQAAYAMSKASLSALTQCAAKELGAVGIRVNGVNPGFIETDLTAHYTEEQKTQLQQHIALNRLGRAEDVAKVIGFLLSDDAAYVSAQILGVDGALSLP